MRTRTPTARNKARTRIAELRRKPQQPEPEPEWVRHVCPHESVFPDMVANVLQCKACGAILDRATMHDASPPYAEYWRKGSSRHEVRRKWKIHCSE